MTVHQLSNYSVTLAICSSYARHYLTKNGQGHHDAQATTNSVVMTKHDEATKDITTAQLTSFLATLTISRESYTNSLENREAFLEHPPVFSNKLAIDAPITNQMSSGRCWIFAELNMLWQKMMKEYNLDLLELSQPYLFFYDKLEKSN
ncbi:bleomycin hydrolase [Coemansia sp. S146]|nr:bleomycin hydrolase [Coemansia sp. S146]